MKRKKLCVLKLIIFFSFLVSYFVSAEDFSRVVRVSCGINKALYLDELGNPQGYCANYLIHLAKINNWKLEYVNDSWAHSVDNLLNNKIDLLFPTQKTESRKNLMGFSTSIGGYQPIGLYALKTSDLCYDDYEGFDGKTVVLSLGTSNEEAMKEYAKNNNFSYKTIELDSTADKVEALQNGSADMIVFSTLNDVPNGKVVSMLDYLPFYYCTRIDDVELQKELNYGMNQMIIRHPDLVQEVFYDFMNKNVSFAYTKAEQEAINKKGSIKICVYKDTEPLFYINNQGSYVGIYVDLIKRISEISGLNIEIIPIDRKNYLLDYLKDNDVDYVFGSSNIALKESDEKKFIGSDGLMDYYSINITRADFVIEKNATFTIALTQGRKYWINILKKSFPNANFKFYLSSKDCLNAIEKKEAELTILNTWEYNYHSKNRRFQNLIEWENSRFLSKCIFVSYDSPEKENLDIISSVINKSIEQITNAEKEAIITANLNIPYSYSFFDKLFEYRFVLLFFICLLILLISIFIVYAIMRYNRLKLLQEKNNQLAKANHAKDSFLSRMSHELRTPLNAISGYAVLMKEQIQCDEINKSKLESELSSISTAVKYQLAIIGDILDFQRIESKRIVFSVQKVNFDICMQTITDLISLEAKNKNIDFSFKRLSHFQDNYLLDSARFQQILLIILNNAIKFTPSGGKISMTAEGIEQNEDSNTIKFVISDNGIGISEEFQKNHLFQSFAQEYEGTTSPYEGCGTGLAICKELINLMGGKISCESKKNEGTTFTIILPIKFPKERSSRRERKPVPNFDLSGTKILLCEDNPMNQEMEKALLERMKCTVDLADDGLIGVEKFKNSQPFYYDIILMDIRMPNLDGLDATTQIRSLNREDAKKVAIIAVSANAFEEDVQKSLQAGMNEHLAKPVDARILYSSMKKYLQKIIE